MGFSSGARGKELNCQRRRLREETWIPGSGRSPGGAQGNPLQSSCLENPMDRGAWRAVVHRVQSVWHSWRTWHPHTRVRLGPDLTTMTERLTFHFPIYSCFLLFWSVIAWQHCVSSHCTAQWISYVYRSPHPQESPSPRPTQLITEPELSPLCCSAGPTSCLFHTQCTYVSVLLTLNYLSKWPISKYSHILRHQSLELQCRNLGRYTS